MTKASQLKRMYRVDLVSRGEWSESRKGNGPVCETSDEAFDVAKDLVEEGNVVAIVPVLMTQEDYDALPEFDGF